MVKAPRGFQGRSPRRFSVRWVLLAIPAYLAQQVNAPGNKRLSPTRRLTYSSIARGCGISPQGLNSAMTRGFSWEMADRVLYVLDADLRDVMNWQIEREREETAKAA